MLTLVPQSIHTGIVAVICMKQKKLFIFFSCFIDLVNFLDSILMTTFFLEFFIKGVMGEQIAAARQEDKFSCKWLFSKAKYIHSD